MKKLEQPLDESDFHGDTLNGRAFTEKNVSFPLETALLKFGQQSIENEQL